MCGIIAVVRRPSTRPTPTRSDVLELLTGIGDLVDAGDEPSKLKDTADRLVVADSLLRGVPGLKLLLSDRSTATEIGQHVDRLVDGGWG